MTIQIRSYKYRIYPKEYQTKFLLRNFGATRFVWNQLVANFRNFGSDDFIKDFSEKDLKEYNPWLKEVISHAIVQKRIDFQQTSKQFFNKNRKTHIGAMKFKKRGSCNDSFRICGVHLSKLNPFDFENNTIKIPKMSPIKCIYDRKFSGVVKNITVSRNKTNQYFVSVCVTEDVQELEKTGRDIGIDLGLTHLLILSDGTKFENPKYLRNKLRKTQAKIKKAQRILARKKKDSKRRQKQKLKLAKLHQKVANQRSNNLHKISTYLVRNFDTICVEDLSIKNMIKNHKLAGAISDASWSILVNQLDYKCKWFGKELVKINRFFASSKTCSVCGSKKSEMSLNVRYWTCSECGTEHDRDINAAENILAEGLCQRYGLVKEYIISKNLSAESVDYSRGGLIRPEEFKINSEGRFETQVINDLKETINSSVDQQNYR